SKRAAFGRAVMENSSVLRLLFEFLGIVLGAFLGKLYRAKDESRHMIAEAYHGPVVVLVASAPAALPARRLFVRLCCLLRAALFCLRSRLGPNRFILSRRSARLVLAAAAAAPTAPLGFLLAVHLFAGGVRRLRRRRLSLGGGFVLVEAGDRIADQLFDRGEVFAVFPRGQ